MGLLIDNWWAVHLFYWCIYELISGIFVAADKESHLNGQHLIFSGIPVIENDQLYNWHQIHFFSD